MRAIVLVVGLVCVTGWGQTMPGDSEVVPPEPRKLFLETIHELQTGRTVDLQVQRRHWMEPRDVLTERLQQQTATMADDAEEVLRLRRPGELRFDHEPVVAPEAESLTLHNIVAGGHLWVPRKSRKPGGADGRVFDVGEQSVDELLASRDVMLRLCDPELELLVDPASKDFFRYATGWKLLGAASDQAAPVWRVGFDSPEEPAKHWEVWISEQAPHRVTRMSVRGESSMGLTIVNPEFGKDNDALSNPEKSKSYTFPVHDKVELVFTKWHVNGPGDEEAFKEPGGVFKPANLSDKPPAFKIGEEVPLPAVSLADGTAVDLEGAHGVVVLDFWFAACGPCREYNPKVEGVVRPFLSQGVKLYGVNPVDSGKALSEALAREPWKNLATIKDEHSELANLLSVQGYPTVVVLDGRGRILYRDHPMAPAGLARLRGVLEKAVK